jgi:hypothetical protein
MLAWASPTRLKAFVLDADGPDVEQRTFLSAVGLSLFLEEIPAAAGDSGSGERSASWRTTSRSTSNAPRWA